MTSFRSKWLARENAYVDGADKTDKKGFVGFVSEAQIGIADRFEAEDGVLFEFLKDRIDLAPLGRCINPLTYRAQELEIFHSFQQWLRPKGGTTSPAQFRQSMVRLFSSKDVRFDLPRREWTGFRFNHLK